MAWCGVVCREENDIVIQKGTVDVVDSYSGFGDEFQGEWERTQLEGVLQAAGITEVRQYNARLQG